jgi:hypothetical protein
MPDRLLGVPRHEAFELRLSILMLEVSLLSSPKYGLGASAVLPSKTDAAWPGNEPRGIFGGIRPAIQIGESVEASL